MTSVTSGPGRLQWEAAGFWVMRRGVGRGGEFVPGPSVVAALGVLS